MLEWYVFVSDFNNRLIKKHNVFDHWRFMEDLKKLARKYRDRERDKFEDELCRYLGYYYWGKCEWEIILDHWPSIENGKYASKTDVREQVMLNWPQFSDYVWAHRAELRRREPKVDSEE